MGHSEEVGAERRVRRWRSVAEKRQIVKQTLEPGAGAATVAPLLGGCSGKLRYEGESFLRGIMGSVSDSRTLNEQYRSKLHPYLEHG